VTSKVNLDELLDILENDDNYKENTRRPKEENKFVNKFINEKSLGPGSVKTPTYIIYYFFHYWFRGNHPLKLKVPGKTEFFRTFNKYFEQKRSKKQRFYYINNVFNITPEIRDEAKFMFGSQKRRYRSERK
jgi:hypothetical protein